MSRPIPDGFNPKQARIVRKASGYFVMLSLQLNVNVPNPLPHGHPRGLDLGFEKFVATSDGLEMKRPRFLKALQYKLKLLSRSTYFAKVDKNGTSQTCPNCGAHTGKKALNVRVHSCNECNYTTTRDVAAAQEVRNRGVSAVLGSPQVEQLTCINAVGQTVVENVCGLDATGSIGNDILVGTVRNRKPN